MRSRKRRNPVLAESLPFTAALKKYRSKLYVLNLVAKTKKPFSTDYASDAIAAVVPNLRKINEKWVTQTVSPNIGAIQVKRPQVAPVIQADTGMQRVNVISALVLEKEKRSYKVVRNVLDTVLRNVARELGADKAIKAVLFIPRDQEKYYDDVIVRNFFGENGYTALFESELEVITPGSGTDVAIPQTGMDFKIAMSVFGALNPFKGDAPELVALFIPVDKYQQGMARPEFIATSNLGAFGPEGLGKSYVDVFLDLWPKWGQPDQNAPPNFNESYSIPDQWDGTALATKPFPYVGSDGVLPALRKPSDLAYMRFEGGAGKESKTLLVFPIISKEKALRLSRENIGSYAKTLEFALRIAKITSNELQRPLTFIEGNLKQIHPAIYPQFRKQALSGRIGDAATGRRHVAGTFIPKLAKPGKDMYSPMTGLPVLKEEAGVTYFGSLKGTEDEAGTFQVMKEPSAGSSLFAAYKNLKDTIKGAGTVKAPIFILNIVDDCLTPNASRTDYSGKLLRGFGIIPNKIRSDLRAIATGKVSLTPQGQDPDPASAFLKLTNVQPQPANPKWENMFLWWKWLSGYDELSLQNIISKGQRNAIGIDKPGDQATYEFNLAWDAFKGPEELNWQSNSFLMKGGTFAYSRLGKKNKNTYVLTVAAKKCRLGNLYAGKQKAMLDIGEFQTAMAAFMNQTMMSKPIVLVDVKANDLIDSEWEQVKSVLKGTVTGMAGRVYAYNVPHARVKPKNLKTQIQRRQSQKSKYADLITSRSSEFKAAENSAVVQYIVVIGKSPKKKQVMVFRKQDANVKEDSSLAFSDPTWWKIIPDATAKAIQMKDRFNVVPVLSPPRRDQSIKFLNPIDMRNFVLNLVNDERWLTPRGFGKFSEWKTFLAERSKNEKLAQEFLRPKGEASLEWQAKLEQGINLVGLWKLWIERALGYDEAIIPDISDRDIADLKRADEQRQQKWLNSETGKTEIAKAKKNQLQVAYPFWYKEIENDKKVSSRYFGDTKGAREKEAKKIVADFTSGKVKAGDNSTIARQRYEEAFDFLNNANHVPKGQPTRDIEWRSTELPVVEPAEGLAVVLGSRTPISHRTGRIQRAYNAVLRELGKVQQLDLTTLDFYEFTGAFSKIMESAPPKIKSEYVKAFKQQISSLEKTVANMNQTLEPKLLSPNVSVSQKAKQSKIYLDKLTDLLDKTGMALARFENQITSQQMRSQLLKGRGAAVYDQKTAKRFAEQGFQTPPSLEGKGMPMPYVYAIFENGAAAQLNFNMDKPEVLWKQPGWKYQDINTWQIDDFWLTILSVIQAGRDSLMPQKMRSVVVDKSAPESSQFTQAVEQIASRLRRDKQTFQANAVEGLLDPDTGRGAQDLGKEVLRSMGAPMKYEGRGWIKGNADTMLYRNLFKLSGGSELWKLKKQLEDSKLTDSQRVQLQQEYAEREEYWKKNAITRRVTVGGKSQWQIKVTDPLERRDKRTTWMSLKDFYKEQRDRAQSSARARADLRKAGFGGNLLDCFIKMGEGFSYTPIVDAMKKYKPRVADGVKLYLEQKNRSDLEKKREELKKVMAEASMPVEGSLRARRTSDEDYEITIDNLEREIDYLEQQETFLNYIRYYVPGADDETGVFVLPEFLDKTKGGKLKANVSRIDALITAYMILVCIAPDEELERIEGQKKRKIPKQITDAGCLETNLFTFSETRQVSAAPTSGVEEERAELKDQLLRAQQALQEVNRDMENFQSARLAQDGGSYQLKGSFDDIREQLSELERQVMLARRTLSQMKKRVAEGKLDSKRIQKQEKFLRDTEKKLTQLQREKKQREIAERGQLTPMQVMQQEKRDIEGQIKGLKAAIARTSSAGQVLKPAWVAGAKMVKGWKKDQLTWQGMMFTPFEGKYTLNNAKRFAIMAAWGQGAGVPQSGKIKKDTIKFPDIPIDARKRAARQVGSNMGSPQALRDFFKRLILNEAIKQKMQ